MAKFKDLEVENITLEAVPPEEKKSWLTIAFIWAGQVVCVPALLCGALIASGLTFKESFLAMVIGYGISVVLMMLIATQAAYTGRPSVIAVTRALGTRKVRSSRFRWYWRFPWSDGSHTIISYARNPLYRCSKQQMLTFLFRQLASFWAR